MNVTVYTTTTCPYCKMLKEYFNQNSVPFIEKLVDQDDQARQQMMLDSGGFLGVPFTTIEKEGLPKETVVGFDKARLDTILGINNDIH